MVGGLYEGGLKKQEDRGVTADGQRPSVFN